VNEEVSIDCSADKAAGEEDVYAVAHARVH
jgi:hypothetical protein